MPVAPEVPVPPQVPGHVLETLLGRGGSGEVWRAVPRSGGPPVAVKILVRGDPERQEREAVLLGSLDHPHLVRLHEVVHLPRRGGPAGVALVLDLLAGGSLAALLARRGRLRPGEVVTAVAPVAAAVAHAHEQGVVHGDLSPGNVVFTAEGRPVLTDLGVGRLLDEEQAAEVTPAYVDPTVARGGAVGPSSDVFGLAAAAFHALTGVAPWNGATPADVLAVAAAGLLPDLDELAPEAPPGLRAVIARGLAADPHARGSAAAFALDLRHACRPEPVRLALGGSAEVDLMPTGAPAAVELTHQVPGRHPRPAPEVVVPRGRWEAWSLRLALRRDRVAAPTGRHARAHPPRPLRGVGAAVLLAGLAAVSVWAVGRGSPSDAGAGRPSPAAAATSASASAASAPPTAEPGARAGSSLPATPGASTAAPAPGGRTPASLAGWRSSVAALYGARAQAFEELSTRSLDAVYTEGSAMRAADAAEISRAQSAGGAVRGFAPEVVEVRSATVVGDRAEVRLVDRWPGYALAGGSGAGIRDVPGRGERLVDMVLVRTGMGWRIDTARLVP